jgi:hypothetical protein
MQIALAVILTVFGLALAVIIFRLLANLKTKLAKLQEEPPLHLERPRIDGPVTLDGLVYLFADDFVKPAPKRPLGSIPRDRSFACQTDVELDCDDFAKQLLYVVLAELYGSHAIETRIVPRDPTYMPPYPHKRWELQMRQTGAFPSSPLCESFAFGFELSRKNRVRSLKGEELTRDQEFFTLEEVLERALKAIRQELSFWTRGTVCSDLRSHVETALVADGYLNAPDRDTWLDTVRKQRSTCVVEAVTPLEHDAHALLRRLETFKKMHGSPYALAPEKDEKGQVVDIDPAVLNAAEDFEGMPFDDVLRATIHEAIVSIKQLEPSGEAGI